MKSKERLREAFEREETFDALTEWLNHIEKMFERRLLTAPEAELIKAKHEYEAAKKFHRDFLTLFDKTRPGIN